MTFIESNRRVKLMKEIVNFSLGIFITMICNHVTVTR